jgi:hypothetical protein
MWADAGWSGLLWVQPQISKNPAFNHVVFTSTLDTKSALSTDLKLVGDYIYTTGQFKGTISVDQGVPLVSQGSMDAFVAKVRASHSGTDVGYKRQVGRSASRCTRIRGNPAVGVRLLGDHRASKSGFEVGFQGIVVLDKHGNLRTGRKRRSEKLGSQVFPVRFRLVHVLSIDARVFPVRAAPSSL